MSFVSTDAVICDMSANRASDLTEASAKVSKIWRDQSTSPLADLQQKMYHVMRDHDFDPNGPLVSDLMAAQLEPLCSRAFIIPSEPIHIVLGLVSDKDVDITVQVGAKELGMPLQLRANIPHPILVDKEGRAWPLKSPEYHEIRLENVNRVPCAIYALGVRIKKSQHSTISDTIVPGICRIHQGMCDTDPKNLILGGEWSPM
jgi:hypothetical protein